MRRIATILLFCFSAFAAQIVRVDPAPVMSTSGNTAWGGNPSLYAVAYATVSLCTDAACSLPATTYTDSTGATACPIYAPVTLPGTATCSSTTGAQGQFGFWLSTSGTLYYYKVTLASGASYGPFPLSIGSAGVSQIIAGSGVTVNNGGVGIVTVSAPGIIPAVSNYNFSPITFGAQSLSAGNPSTITLSPVPSGVNATNPSYYLYITGCSGGNQSVLITGGTAVSGASSGTLTFTPANTCAAGWSLSSASSGLQETICGLSSTGGEVLINNNPALTANVNSCSKTDVALQKEAGSVVSGSFTIMGSNITGVLGTLWIGNNGWDIIPLLTLAQVPVLPSQTANQIFAAPNGSAGAPAFRDMVGADVPPINLASTAKGGVAGTLPVGNGGTGGTTQSTARAGIGAAASGANADITSLGGITTPLPVNEGGTGSATQAGALSNVLGSSQVPIANGGTGAATQSAALAAVLGSSQVPVANGGTGGATAAAGLANLLSGSKQGSGTNVQMAGTNSGVSGAPLCNDGGGSTTTSGCASSLPSGSQTQFLRLQPNAGNSTTYQWSNLPTLQISDYNWTPQAPGGSLATGSNTITLTPCPLGIAGSYASLYSPYLYISGGTGAAEPVPLTGGSCTSGAASGTVVVTAANNHTGAWTIGPASAGLQEAIDVACAAGGGLTLNMAAGTWNYYGTVTEPCSGIRIRGAGSQTSIIYRTTDYGETIIIGTPTTQVNDVEISELEMNHDVGVTYGSPPSACKNLTPLHPAAAHLHMYDCVHCKVEQTWLFDMPYNLRISGGALNTYTQNSFIGLWDYANSNCQQSIANVLVESTVTQTAVLLDFYANSFRGWNSAARSVTYGTAVETVQESIGPKYLLQITSCESCRWIGGEFERGDYYSVYIAPTGTYPMLQLAFTGGIHFDGSRIADVAFDPAAETSGAATNITFSDDIFDGELASLNAVKFMNTTGFGPYGTKFSNNHVYAYISSCLDIENGGGTMINENNIHGCNIYNGFSTPATASGVYVANPANVVQIQGNIIGGGLFYEAYGTGQSYMVYGVSLANAGTYGVAGNIVPPSGLSTTTDTAFSQFFSNNGKYPGWVAPAVTFTTLGTCAAGLKGASASVSDSTTQTWGATVTGGGSFPALAYCDGSSWTVAGK